MLSGRALGSKLRGPGFKPQDKQTNKLKRKTCEYLYVLAITFIKKVYDPRIDIFQKSFS